MSGLVGDAAGNALSDNVVTILAVVACIAISAVGVAIVWKSRGDTAVMQTIILFAAFIASLTAFCLVRAEDRNAIGAIAAVLGGAIARGLAPPPRPSPDPPPTPQPKPNPIVPQPEGQV